jgi:hypothetical protein
MTALSCIPALVALAAAQAPPPRESSPRVVLTLAVGHAGALRLTVENAADRPAFFAGDTYLVLTRGPYDAEQSYWARFETDATPSDQRAVPLAGRAKVARAIRPAELSWAEDRSGLGHEQPLRRMVPPSAYRVQVRVQAPDGGWWRSNELDVELGPAGSLRYK